MGLQGVGQLLLDGWQAVVKKVRMGIFEVGQNGGCVQVA